MLNLPSNSRVQRPSHYPTVSQPLDLQWSRFSSRYPLRLTRPPYYHGDVPTFSATESGDRRVELKFCEQLPILELNRLTNTCLQDPTFTTLCVTL